MISTLKRVHMYIFIKCENIGKQHTCISGY